MSKEITIIIATESKDKIEGIKNAFLQYFPSEEYTIKIYINIIYDRRAICLTGKNI